MDEQEDEESMISLCHKFTVFLKLLHEIFRGIVIMMMNEAVDPTVAKNMLSVRIL